MSDPARWNGPMPPTRQQPQQQPAGNDGTNLADILERVLDKGIVIAGDIQINLLDIELLTIKLRLVVASVDRAKEMGIDWWERDPTLSSGHAELEEENRRLRERLDALEGRTSRTGDAAAIEDAEVEDAEVDDGDAADVEDADVEDADVEDAEAFDDIDEDAADRDEPEPEPEPADPPRRRSTAKRGGRSGASSSRPRRTRS